MQTQEQKVFNQCLFGESLWSAQQSANSIDALYLSFCYLYGIGTVRDEHLALHWCTVAADQGSGAAKSIAKMLFDAYSNTATIHTNEELERLKRIGIKSSRYLLEALYDIQKLLWTK